MVRTIKKMKAKYFVFILSILLFVLTLIITLSESALAVELPNVYISNINYSASRKVGQLDTFTVTVKNGGTVDAGSFRVDMYDNPTPEPPVLLQEGVSNQQATGLAANSTMVLTFTRSWSTVGSHKIYFQADTLGEVAESIESNVINPAINVNVWDDPDLIVLSMTVLPPTIKSGDTAGITVVIKNQGQDTFHNTEGADISLYTNLSSPPSLSQDPNFFYYFDEDLAPGETFSHTYNIKFNTAGARHMYAYVDWDDIYAETNENNNSFGPVDLTVNTKPVAYIDSITPNPVLQGQNISFNGHGTTDSSYQIDEYSWRSDIDGVISNSQTFNQNNLSLGTRKIYFKVKDSHGQWSEEASTTLDVIPIPSTSLNLSIAEINGWHKSIPQITLTRNVNGSTFYKWDSGSWLSYTGSFNALRGVHTMYYYSTDNYNNNEATKSKQFKVDDYKPRTYAPYKKTTTRGRSAKLYWKVSDPYTASKAYVSLKLQRKSGRIYKTVKSINYGLTTINQLRNFSQKFKDRGTFKFLVYAKDQVGNKQYNIASNYIIVK